MSGGRTRSLVTGISVGLVGEGGVSASVQHLDPRMYLMNKRLNIDSRGEAPCLLWRAAQEADRPMKDRS